MEVFQGAYPSLDVMAAIKKADAWCVANQGRAPRKRHARFVNSWLARERPINGSRPAVPTLTQEELYRLKEEKRGEAVAPKS